MIDCSFVFNFVEVFVDLIDVLFFEKKVWFEKREEVLLFEKKLKGKGKEKRMIVSGKSFL